MAVAPRCTVVALGLLAGCLLAGCAAAPAQKPVPAPAPAPAIDWRSLPILPFGSALQDLQVPAHEVLMFGELAGQECYGLDTPSQPFPGRAVETYLLCFAKGRLNRVELTMSLPRDEAAAEFSRYCDQWRAGAPGSPPRSAERCSGTVPQGPSFSAVLGEAPGDSPEESTVPLLIVVSESPVPDSP
jgi:hypothetical protein